MDNSSFMLSSPHLFVRAKSVAFDRLSYCVTTPFRSFGWWRHSSFIIVILIFFIVLSYVRESHTLTPGPANSYARQNDPLSEVGS